MNSKTFKTLLLGCVLTLAPSAWASTSYDFSSPSGLLGTSQAYVSNGITITAYGYSSPNVGTALFGKANGGDENGLGINGTTDNEIVTTDFIELDLTALLATHPATIKIAMNSTTSPDGWNFYASSALGTRGTVLLLSGTTEGTFTLPAIPGGDNFVSVQASAGNVLLASLATTTPEPGTMGIFGAGLVAIGLLARRFRRS